MMYLIICNSDIDYYSFLSKTDTCKDGENSIPIRTDTVNNFLEDVLYCYREIPESLTMDLDFEDFVRLSEI